MFGNFKQVADFLRQAEADIICLQEVQADDPDRDLIKYLTGQGFYCAFVPVKKEWGSKVWNDGPAVFSRYPIIKKENYFLSEKSARAAVRADIQIDDKVLHVFSAHLIHTHQQQSDVQEEQGRNLISHLTDSDPLIMGAFNATPESAIIKTLREKFIDADPASIPTWSVYPKGCPTCDPQEVNIRLDYIFTTPDIRAANFKVQASKASDHLPVSAFIEF